ncbi:MAG: ADP-glyceromanno-heptose 6-epimerase [Candidatus Kapabacteria bacterium]|nr:ADP-glyceromanno-heptose 6-epimerase [Candidatus Kapabacteria bacterium]
MIILTGGAGFIGSCFLKKLNDEGIDDIIVVDSFRNSDKWKNLVGKKFVEFLHKDEILPILDVSQEVESKVPFDAIIHLGACTDTTEKDMDYLFQNNYQFSTTLARFALENDIKFIYASSAATYGDGQEGYSDKQIENLKPLNPYGYSKQLFDIWVHRNNFDKIFTGIKFFNVFGPNEYHKGEMASMVYKAYNQVKTTGKIKLFKSNSELFADGEQQRDFVYVKDVVEVLWKILNNKKALGIVNLGTGKARTWNSLANSVFSALDMEPNIEYIDMPDNLMDQYQNFTQADIKKLQKSGCSVNFTSLEDSINDYVRNYLTKSWKYY